jgi:hypothetical protein
MRIDAVPPTAIAAVCGFESGAGGGAAGAAASEVVFAKGSAGEPDLRPVGTVEDGPVPAIPEVCLPEADPGADEPVPEEPAVPEA